MGMLLRRHRLAREAAGAETPAEEQPDAVSPYEALTDDEVFEAYVTNVDGDAESREDMITELSELDAD